MFSNYLKITFRNLLRYKGYSFINIAGLAVGLACCIVIIVFDQYELGYDRMYPNADRIYRVSLRGRVNNTQLDMAVSCGPLAAALNADLPEVEAVTRLVNNGFPVLRYNDKVFSEERFFRADSTFFRVFPMPFVKGDPEKALAAPWQVVITQSMARKYFGNEDPVGKRLNMDRLIDWTVTGVIEDIPEQSHFHCDFIGSLTVKDDNWLSNNYHTYFLLRQGTDMTEFQRKLNQLVKDHVGPQVEAALGVSFDQMLKAGSRYGYIAEPLTSIHLHSHLDHEIEPNGDVSYVYIFSAIAVAILLIGCFNFMNLSTARSERRAKEVGIRKTLGSQRWQLIRQFSMESILMCAIAVAIALIAVEFLLPFFRNLSGKEIHLSLFDSFWTIPALLLFTIGVGILAGSYPAFFLSSFQPLSALKQEAIGGARSRFRSGLVVFQFVISIVLMIGTFIVYRQLGFIQNKNLGFDQEQVIVVEKVDDIGAQLQPFKSQILSAAGILSATNSTSLPGRLFGDSAFKVEGTGGEQVSDLMVLGCDVDFAKTFDLKMQTGRFFSREHPSDTMAVVLNATAVRQLGITDPVGKRLLAFSGGPGRTVPYEIVGVVNDFNFESLHREIRPLVFLLFHQGSFGRVMSVKVEGGTYQKTLAELESAWHTFAGEQAFEYTFFDQNIARMYMNEQRTGKIVTVFSVLAIVIACLGLLGLAAFVAERRTKEIGIRKVMGASVAGIVKLLTREFVILVVIANLVAWPIAYWITNRWLQDFAYRITIGIWVFLAAGVLALLIAFMAVAYQAVKAALANPVEALRCE